MSVRKIVNKAKYWHKHGKRRGVLGLSQELNRELSKTKPGGEMFGSMGELMASRKRRRR